MTMSDLFSATTRKSLQLREDWMRKLFSNPRLDALDKVVLIAFMFWYYPEHEKSSHGTSIDYAEFAQLIGTSEDEAEEAVLRMVRAGVLELHDEHGHKLDVMEHYTCNDCGHEWDERDEQP